LFAEVCHSKSIEHNPTMVENQGDEYANMADFFNRMDSPSSNKNEEATTFPTYTSSNECAMPCTIDLRSGLFVNNVTISKFSNSIDELVKSSRFTLFVCQ
jgi:hypothetical protein